MTPTTHFGLRTSDSLARCHMRRPDRLLFVLLWAASAVFLMRPAEVTPAAQTNSGSTQIVVPKIWDSKQLATWATPVAGLNATPNFYSEEEYYAAPVDNLRTYPVYAPDKEPKGYREWMLKQGPQRLIEPETLKTERDWIEAGRAVFGGLDFPVTRTDDSRIMKFLSDAEAVRKGGDSITKDGIIPAIRWVVDRDGKLKV